MFSVSSIYESLARMFKDGTLMRQQIKMSGKGFAVLSLTAILSWPLAALAQTQSLQEEVDAFFEGVYLLTEAESLISDLAFYEIPPSPELVALIESDLEAIKEAYPEFAGLLYPVDNRIAALGALEVWIGDETLCQAYEQNTEDIFALETGQYGEECPELYPFVIYPSAILDSRHLEVMETYVPEEGCTFWLQFDPPYHPEVLTELILEKFEPHGVNIYQEIVFGFPFERYIIGCDSSGTILESFSDESRTYVVEEVLGCIDSPSMFWRLNVDAEGVELIEHYQQEEIY
jgi:hypothetical protein